MTEPRATITFGFAPEGTRRCGSCQLCCKLLPMDIGAMVNGVDAGGSYHKPAGEPCRHQRHGQGCNIYAKRPWACRHWSCRWLTNDDTADLKRPDRSRYVVDMVTDFCTWVDNNTGQQENFEVIQVWCDPKNRDAWRDPALLAFLDRRGQEGKAAVIRYSNNDGFTLIPPSMCADGQWHEVRSSTMGRDHSFEEKIAAISTAKRLTFG